jgi:6-bladed beta-propeller
LDVCILFIIIKLNVMRKYVLFKIYIIIFIILVSCKQHETQYKKYLETIDLKMALTNRKEILLSQIASKIEYIPLETNEDCFIAEVTQLFTYKDKVIIYDQSQQKVLLFNNNGKFINRIGKQGRGPGEYIETMRVNFNEFDSTIVIKDNCYNFYNLNGKFLRRKLVYPLMGQIAFLENHIVLSFGRPEFVYNDGFQIAICDNDFKLQNQFINRNNEGITKANAGKIRGNMMNCLQFCCDTLSFWEYKYDTIFRIPDTNTCFPRYALKYPNKQGFNVSADNSDQDGTRVIEGMVETKNYFFFKQFNQFDKAFINEIIYDKKKKEGFSLKFPDKVHGILNDIDGGIEVLPRKVLNDGRIYTTFSAFKLRQLMNEEPYKSIKPIDIKNHIQLKEIIKNSKMQDNPIVMIITLK